MARTGELHAHATAATSRRHAHDVPCSWGWLYADGRVALPRERRGAVRAQPTRFACPAREVRGHVTRRGPRRVRRCDGFDRRRRGEYRVPVVRSVLFGVRRLALAPLAQRRHRARGRPLGAVYVSVTVPRARGRVMTTA